MRAIEVYFRYLVFILASALSACVFPTRLAEETPFGEEVIGTVEVGETTRQEILARIGEPAESYAQGGWWVYHATREMTEWFAVICVPNGECGASDFGGDDRPYSLLIEFNEENVLQNTIVVHEKKPCSRDGSVCYREGAIELARANAMPLVSRPGACAVIIYGRTPALRFDVRIHIAGDEAPTVIEYRRPLDSRWSRSRRTHYPGGEAPVGYLTDRSFLQVPLKEGQYEIRTISALVSEAVGAIELHCARGEVHFGRLLYEEPNVSSFEFVDPQLGRDELRDRSLRLLPDR
ncbi:MAG: hypothetical protein KJP17_10475 [Gammaproteobacteria bacterium]|nr:hypothetical protein [Gammaproteobacteria bacterium]